MKHRSAETIISDLTAADVPRSEAEILARGAGLTGQNAADFIKKKEGKDIEITPAAQRALFSTVYAHYESEVRRISGKPSVIAKYGSVDWDNLHPTVRDVAVDLIYRGDFTTATRKEVQPLIAAGDLQGPHDLLADEARMTEWGGRGIAPSGAGTIPEGGAGRAIGPQRVNLPGHANGIHVGRGCRIPLPLEFSFRRSHRSHGP